MRFSLKENRSSLSTPLSSTGDRGDLVRIVRFVRIFSATPDKPPGKTKKQKARGAFSAYSAFSAHLFGKPSLKSSMRMVAFSDPRNNKEFIWRQSAIAKDVPAGGLVSSELVASEPL